MDLEVGVWVPSPKLDNGTSGLVSGIIGRQVAARDIITYRLETADLSADAVVPQGFDIHFVAVAQPQRRQILRVDKYHFPLAVHAAITIVQSVNGGVVLVVGTQGLQGKRHRPAAGVWKQGVRQRSVAEFRFAAGGIEPQFGRGVTEVKAPRLFAALIEILEPGQGGGNMIADKMVISRQRGPVHYPVAQHRFGNAGDNGGFRTLLGG